MTASTCSPAPQRRIHLEIGVERAQALVGQREVVRRGLGGHAHAAALRPAERMSTLLAVETCMMCSRPPVASASAMSRLVITSSAAAGIPGQAEHQRGEPLVHHAVLRQLADLGVVQDRLVEHQAILEGAGASVRRRPPGRRRR